MPLSRFFRAIVATAVLATALFGAPAPTHAEAGALTSEQRSEINKLIHQYILDNPQVILESVQRMQAETEQKSRQQAQANVATYHEQLVNDPDAPVIGNPKGNVTVVEFFDYRCGYCKRVFPAVQELLKSDDNIRYVFKEFPILGPDSVFASRAALALWRMDKSKYHAFHAAMMLNKGALPESKVLSLASSLGIDAKALRSAAEAPEIDKILARNFKLAEALNINGTPAFVIGDELIPGAADLDTLRQKIRQARGS